MAVPPGSRGWATRARESARLDGPPVDVEIGPDTASDVFHTSGTTGPPKAMLVTHGDLGFGRGLDKVAAEAFDGGAPIAAPMPLGSAASAGMVAIFALTSPSTIVVCPADDPEEVAATIARTGAGSLMATPALVMAMVDLEVWQRHDLSTLTTIGVASAQLPPRYGRALAQHLPQAAVLVTYGGGSEAIPANIRGAYDPARPGCVGRPSPGTTLRLVAAGAGEPVALDLPDVAPGEVGRVVLRHEAPLRRFLDPVNDRGVYVDGWVVTNDLARLDPEDGLVRVFDRGEDAIPTRGGLLSSLAVERLLFEHPDVREAAVVAGPGGDDDELIGFVVLRSGSTATGQDVLAAAARYDGAGLRPGRLHRLAELPRGPQGGKVLKRELRALVAPQAPRSWWRFPLRGRPSRPARSWPWRRRALVWPVGPGAGRPRSRTAPAPSARPGRGPT